jgi:hypothetical protein
MRLSIADRLREISAGIVLEIDDTPEPKKKKVTEPTKKIELTQKKPDDKEETISIPTQRALPDEVSKDVKKAKRPWMKPPRRITDYKAKWKGTGSRETRKQYQKEYRQEHGSGYTKKVKTAINNQYDAVFKIGNHEAKQIGLER